MFELIIIAHLLSGDADGAFTLGRKFETQKQCEAYAQENMSDLREMMVQLLRDDNNLVVESRCDRVEADDEGEDL